MKKIIVTAIVAAIFSIGAYAQKYALVDMEYILKNIPQYEMANEQLNQVSLRWQKEVETKTKEAETLYKNYQSDMVFLTDEQKNSCQRKRSGRTASKIFRSARRTLQETPVADGTDTERHLRGCQESVGRKRLSGDFRPRLIGRHCVCVAKNRHKQRSTVQIRIFKGLILSLPPKKKTNLKA